MSGCCIAYIPGFAVVSLHERVLVLCYWSAGVGGVEVFLHTPLSERGWEVVRLLICERENTFCSYMAGSGYNFVIIIRLLSRRRLSDPQERSYVPAASLFLNQKLAIALVLSDKSSSTMTSVDVLIYSKGYAHVIR